MNRSACLLGLPLLLGLAACQDGISPAAPQVPSFDKVGESTPSVVTWDDRLAAIDVDGFGGFYQDRDELVVYSVNPNIDWDQLRSQLAQLRAETEAELASEFRVETATYAFADLHRWRMKLRSLLSRADVNTLRIEDAANRIAIGITPGSTATALVSEIERLGVPLDAVIYDEVDPIHFDATLRDKVRYTVGGLEISNEADQICTMGFNAYWGPSRVFITASHCTNGMGGVQGDEYFQPQDTGAQEGPMTLGPWVPPGYEVGVERKDPAWTLGCDGDYLCRYSDSAIVDYYTGVGSDHGELARTTGIGSITISTTTPRWHITGEQALLAGQVAHRVGRSSGYQTGEVEDSCDDVEIGGFKVLCSVKYGVGSSSGDSGAPVFRVVSSSNVRLAGIHFASNSTTSWFSPISQIRQELETPLYPLTTY